MSFEDAFLVQAMRLVNSALKSKPKTGEDHARALRRSCANLTHATAVVDMIVDTMRVCPLPVDIARFALDTPVTEQPKRPGSIKCELCVDGWVYAWFLTDMRGGMPQSKQRITKDEHDSLIGKIDTRTQMLYTGVERCPACR